MLEDFLQRTPFFRVAVPFAAGIALSGAFRMLPSNYIMAVMLILFLISFVVALKGGFRRNQISGAVFNLFFLFAGVTIHRLHNTGPHFRESDAHFATLLETPDERPKSLRAEVMIDYSKVGDTLLKTNENIIVYFGKNDSSTLLRAGDQIIFFRDPQLIINDRNPYAFDYKGYMNRRGINRQVWLPDGSWIKTGNNQNTGVRVLAERIRNHLLEIYRKNGLSGDEYAILSALTLGYRKSLDPEVKQTFANSGAMHVLAVSGLHVGIIFLAFRLIFSFMKRSRWGRLSYILLAIILLWSYAFITGLSPSVQRAAFMFSLVQIGDGLRRPVNIYNTLAASAMILLLMNPSMLFEVGFQLSYSAVFAIVYFQPKLEKLIDLKHKLSQKVWSLFTVSVAAQIGTFAISAFYFKQFPVWFWVTNFLVIPAAFLLIVFAATILLLSPFPMLSALFAKITAKLVSLVYSGLKLIEQLPYAVYTGFNFNRVSLILAISIILILVLFIESKRKGFLFLGMALIAFILLNSTMMRYHQNSRKELIVYDYKEPLIHLIYGRKNYVLIPDGSASEEFENRAVENVVKAMNLEQPVKIVTGSSYEDNYLLKSGNFVCFSGKLIAIRTVNEDLKGFDFDYIIDFRRPDQIPVLNEKTTLILYSPNHWPIAGNIYSIANSGAFRTQLK